jgi:SAM-dependent methyltransferase
VDTLEHPDYSDANAFKADFNDIYRRRDPRAYYQVLGGLDYVIPDVARPIFVQLAERCALERRHPVTILDVGCSYGVNAAQVRHGLSVRQLRERYLSPQIEHLSSERLAELDSRYFASWPVRDEFRFVGLDPSGEAIHYGRRAGLLAEGLAVDLESEPLDVRARGVISQADLIISTGCVGYVTATTFAKLLRAGNPRVPWIASFVLRMFDFEPIANTLAEFGMTTEKFPGATFVQRRFRDAEECERTITALREKGLDPSGKESEGLLHAELFVSRPTASVSETPLTDLVSLTSGIARAFGDRHRDHLTSGIELAA